MAELSFQRADQTSTEIVRSIFDASVGVCIADFSCSHYRQRGRMYAATNAIAFFSNLFGFERRICLQLDDVSDIRRFRTTSVQLTTVEGEQYIFKSFENRELVVLLLQQLKQEHTSSTATVARPRTYSDDQSMEQRLSPLETSVEFSLPPMLDNHQGGENSSSTTRQRTKSLSALDTESMMKHEGETQRSDGEPLETQSHTAAAAIDGGADATFPVTEEPVSSSDMIPLENPSEPLPELDSRELWEHAKNANDPPYNETSIDELLLPCTLDEFFALFLADNAPHAMDAYQHEYVGDTELNVSPWKKEAESDIHIRLIEFRHPLPKGLGVGPTSALAKRRQRFKRYGEHGFCMETSTNVKGTIASDCFFVDDKWIVEATTSSDINVKLTVKHQVRFTKRTMLKRIIQSTSNAEAQAWYEGYSRMLLESLKQRGSERVEPVVSTDGAPKEDTTTATVEGEKQSGHFARFVTDRMFALLVCGCLIAGIGFLLLQMVSLHDKLESLEDEVERLREDNYRAFARLEEAMGACIRASNATDRYTRNE